MTILTQPRLAALRERMQQAGFDALFFNRESNVTWLSGFTNHESFVLLTGNQAGAANYLITDSRYTEQAKRECAGFEVVKYRDHFPPLPETVQLLCARHGVKRLGFEPAFLSFAQYEDFRKVLEPAVCFQPAPTLAEALRVHKDDSEAQALQIACAATDQVFDGLCRYIKAGLTEKQIEWQLLTLVNQQGCESSFQPIVVSGANGALPHGVAGNKVVENGEFITMDFGCMYQGYHADMTRTVHVGPASDLHKKVYNIVLEAHLRAKAQVRAGVCGKIPDAAARDYISQQGYGDHFGHGLGHGVGLDIHELPFMSPRCEDTLQAGSFVTIEPGIYIGGQFGVRIEDTVRVTEDGCVSMFASSKELIEL